ncbi:MAG TPA: ABC transporter permease [Gemmatimonadaceae bacterium]|nr:ABC transporter permease [Gemmatimonadaceae bacterium]
MASPLIHRMRVKLAFLIGGARRRELEQRLADETRFHIEMATERHVRSGMSAADARRTALAEFGGRERWKDEARDEYRSLFVEELGQDIRYALRGFRRSPAFTAAVAGTLAAGVAALTLAFGVVDAAVWRQPPFADAAHVSLLYTKRTAPDGTTRTERWSYPRIQLLRKSARAFSLVANFSPTTLNIVDGGDPESVQGEIVSSQYFPLLRVVMHRGRAFEAADDDAPGRAPVAILSYDLWRRRFDGDPAVLGRVVTVNGFALTVVGVAPRGFRGITDKAELWVPTTMAPSLTYPEYLTTNQNFISVVGRLASGADLGAANAELATLGPRINAELPPNDRIPDEVLTSAAVSLNAARLDASTRRALFVLLGAVALLHMLACANAINLLLGRAAARRREASLRAALGGTTGRLVRHYGAEALVAAGAGSAFGVVVAVWLAPFVAVPANVRYWRNFFGSIGAFDTPAGGARVALFGIAIAMTTALVAACVPAVGLVNLDAQQGLSSGARSAAPGGASLRRPSARGAVVALETALAVLLVVVAGLMVESFSRMRQTDIGLRTDHLLTFWVRPSEVAIPPRAAPQFISKLIASISTVPGVVAVSVDGGMPLSGSASSTLIVMGRPVPPRLDDAPPIDRHYVGPDHFKTLGVPLVRGRVFTDADDSEHPRVAIISETAARRFWPGENPIGARVWFGGGSSFDRPDSSAEIVGVVGDVADEPLDGRPNRASFYTPYKQFSYATRAVFVRTSIDPVAIVPAVRKAVASVVPGLPLYDVQTMEERAGGSWARHRFDAILFATFGIAALVLAAVGTYAVVAYAVGRRTREMGIRMALGARPESVVRLVVKEGLTFPAVGLAAGIAGALAVTRLLAAQLYGIGATDLRVFGATAGLLIAVSALACVVPALRATRADPLEALRSE